MPPKPSRVETNSVEIWKVSGEGRKPGLDSVICEAEVAIRVEGRLHCRLCCLPTHIEELVSGHLISQGIAPSSIEVREEADGISVDARRQGKRTKPKKITSQARIAEDQVFDFLRRLNQNCPLFQKTGGTHVVGLFSGGREVFIEDISRHCAIDKIVGLASKRGLDLSHSVLVTSCRQTLSTMKKAIYAQIPIVITISAVTGLAIENADRFGITLIGFAREGRFNIYSHPWRILPR